MLKPISRIIAAGAVALAPAVAGAASYEVTDYAWDTGLWTGHMVQTQGGGHIEDRKFNQWSISNGRLTIDDGTGAARMTGTATNRKDANLAADLVLDMTLNPASGNMGYCQFGGAPFACAEGNRHQAAFDTASWDYFDLDGGTLTGLGEMAGMTFELSDVSGGKHLPQMGVGANAFDREDLGFSTWMSWAATAGSVDHSSVYDFVATSSGKRHFDVNVDLALASFDENDPPAVPVPAAGLLLLGGIGALGALRARKAKG